MSDILTFNKALDTYLEQATLIDVNNDAETLEVITEKLKYASEQHPELSYITANQIGFNKQVFLIHAGEHNFIFANPLMSRGGDMKLSREAEFGLEHEYLVPRWVKIHMSCYDVLNKTVGEEDFEGNLAFILQHVLNNLDGISIEGIGLEVLPEFDAATDSERAEVVAEYFKGLAEYQQILDSELRTDSELALMLDAIEFVKKKSLGLIKTEQTQPKMNRKQRRGLQKMFGLFKRKKK